MYLNKSINRLIKDVVVFRHEQEDPITGKDIKSFNLQDDWVVYMDEDHDRHKPFFIHAYTTQEETDEEYEARLAEIKRIEEDTFEIHKKHRYEQYLKLREEFEPGPVEL